MILLLLASALAEPMHHDHSAAIGKVNFQTSCTDVANRRFRTGLAWLHSFEYAQAEAEFEAAAAADPNCAIAWWGAAVSNYHPLWAAPTKSEMERGRRAVANARAATSRTDRETAFVEAIGTFFDGPDTRTHKNRVTTYNNAMASVHRDYPDDREAAVLYALSEIAVGSLDDDREFEREKRAGVVLNKVLEVEPDHPGVAHYLIHSFDYPALAHFAVPAAKRYASIAPDSPHAQHMPSHIFTRLGMWSDSIASNRKSAAAAHALAKAKNFDSGREQIHAMDYLAYAYLQTAQDADAQRVLDELYGFRTVDEPIFSVAYAVTAIPARVALETRRWRDAAALTLPDHVARLAPLDNFRWAQSHVHLARAIGLARTGDAAGAAREADMLLAIENSVVVPAGTYDWRKKVTIERQVAEAWQAFADGRKDEAVRIMRSAADLDDVTEKHPVTPGSIVPAREQLGELLLELNRPAEALAEFEQSLTRAPRRLAGLYGAARSARLSGNAAKARTHYSAIVELASEAGGERAEVREARSELSRHASQ